MMLMIAADMCPPDSTVFTVRHARAAPRDLNICEQTGSFFTNTFFTLDKCIQQFRQIHFCNLNKKTFTVRHAHRALDGPPLVIWIFANKLFHICRLIKSLIPHQIFCNIYFASNIPDQIFEYLWANWSPFVSTSNLCCFSRLLQKRICRRRSFYDLSVNSPDPFLTSPRAPTNSTRTWISTCPFPLLLNFYQKKPCNLILFSSPFWF